MRGGYGTGKHGTLAERVAGTASESASTPPPRGTPNTPARHCHVNGEPSLLVEWCRTERGWEGRVISVLWVDAVGWATVERWLPAEDITPL
jgi:hypothetical protein